MKKVCLFLLLLGFFINTDAQTTAARLAAAWKVLQADPQLQHALSGICVIDQQTGKTVFASQAETGMAPASTQKLFTSVASFEQLGKEFRFVTEIFIAGSIDQEVLKGDLIVRGSGDPTLGSWRWPYTKKETVFADIFAALKAKGIKKVEGRVIADLGLFERQPLPDGWIWQDIGNYYGAGAWGLNWHENQYDLRLRSGSKVGEHTSIVSIDPPFSAVRLSNGITTGPKGSGDNAYIYLPPYSDSGFTTGTIPSGESSFVISGSIPDPPLAFLEQLVRAGTSAGIFGNIEAPVSEKVVRSERGEVQPILSIRSPTLDSINYWFLRKSVNLYGEALAKMLAASQKKTITTENGVEVMRNYFASKGISRGALQMMDGSGLSPQNRVTPRALVMALQFAATRPWFVSFHQALPEYNGMKMKSGSIGGARAYAGYHRSKAGINYTFSIIVNNYEGSSSEVVRKMYRVLDELK